MIRECGSVVFARRGAARRAVSADGFGPVGLRPSRGLLRSSLGHSGVVVAGVLPVEFLERGPDPSPPIATPGPLHRATRHRAGHRTPRPRPRRRLRPRPGSPRRVAHVAVGEERRIRRELGAIDRDQPGVDQPGLHAQRQHLTEQPRDRVLMAAPEPGQRGVIRTLVRRPTPDTRHRRPGAVRSAARTAPQCNTRTPTPPASSPGHTPHRPDRRAR